MKTLVLSKGTVGFDRMYPERNLSLAARAAFDDLTRLTTCLTQAPIALLCLVDAKGQWLQSQVGLEPEATDSYLTLCAEIIAQLDNRADPVSIVEDTLVDPRFNICTRVTSLQLVRFCAMAPLVTHQGLLVGLLLAIDRIPRQLTAQQQEALGALSRQASTQIELHQKVRDLEESASQYPPMAEIQPASYQHSDIQLALDRASIVAITDYQGKINYVNDNFCKISNYSREEVYGKTHHLINSDYHSPDFFKQLWTTISRGKVWRGDIKDKAKDGSFYWVDTTIVPILDREGKPYEYISICKDITEQKQAEEDQERFFKLSPDLMCVLGFDGYFKRVNPTFEKTLSYSAAELLSKPLISFVHPEDRATTLAELEKLAQKSPTVRFENRYRCKDGSYKWLSWNSLGLVEEGIAHAIARDITASKETKATLLERSRLSTLEADVGEALVGQNGTLSESLKRCMEAMVHHLHAIGAGIWTVDAGGAEKPNGVSLHLQACVGQLSPAELFPECILPNKSLIATVAQTRQPLNHPLSTFSEGTELKTFLGCYPLIVDSQLVGVIALHSHRPFSLVVQGVLGWVANAIAVAIDRVWAREELLSRREALLFQLASQIRNSLELDTILDAAVNEIRSLLGVDGCHFLWCGLESDSPSINVTHEALRSDLPSLLAEYPQSELAPLAKVLGNLQPLQIDDVSKASDMESEMRSLLKNWGITSGLILPLKTQTGQVGAIVCSHSHEPRQWNNHEVELLQAVVNQLAIAIEHAELFAKTRADAIAAQNQARQLEETLNELRQTEARLIQTEKMSTIGQMVAGIAHEINNPVNFITGNLTHATNYIQDLLELINSYQAHYLNPVPAIQTLSEDIELPFLIEDLPKILSSMKMGAERIHEIVVSLRNFSRQDQAEMKPANLHEGLESTLLILRNRTKACGNHPGITLIKEYDNLPLVECYAGQLNQVFMNIISNAIDALTDTEGEPNPNPTIWIRTEVLENNQVAIRIRDNGPGMTQSVVERLFDPFFTTKPIGKGTGLGLSISHQIIVEKHGGSLECISEPGRGTEFWIQIASGQSSVD
ncbi:MULTISPECIES: PAS domain S-box protein [unclassified Coleofasciculus]|uniref:PAS domain S-box protein n=1 Tax=unclassified Coleofasciculus TaxID=2692782 RepID=UPI00187E57F8|nr:MULTISPECIES: PAS domain S-box protein [unclassified Coleofasciculus]MBE9126796.1 PAS domain S-box protein [Coleofasciculus sp. LEGE 07081]MBE9150167.1 PAS domain S-box protein [Coleofasciculus sp. LEGE 07092]